MADDIQTTLHPEERDEAPAERPRRVYVRMMADTDSEETDAATTEEMARMMGLYEESLKDIDEGEIVRGTVLRVDEKEVLVDVGFKSEGVIPIEEFPDRNSIKPGDQVEVYLERMENQDGLVVLSKQRADFVRVWDRVKDAADKGEVVEGRIIRKIKGGVVVDLFGVEAFLPGSQIALRQVQNIDELMNQTLRFKIIKLNKRRRNIVVSRRAVLEEERAALKSAIITELAKDQVREGVVKNITDFGAFVDLGGIDGLLHITDMSWGRVSHPSEVVQIGQKIQVKVLSFDPEKERISLGLKQLTPYPWENVDKKYSVGQRVKGRVVSITDYGAFVELEKGVEGLIHVSEMSWTRHVRHPSKVVSQNDIIEAVVLKVDKENEKISLGLKQTEPDPWQSLDQKYPVGSRVSGKVRNLTNFGAFVELEEGIDGLVHVSDMSWTRRVNHPSEILKKGDKVDVQVLNIDKDNRRVSLGIKQLEDDPWPALSDRFVPGQILRGPITRILDRGVIMDLGDNVEGFVPSGQLGVDNLKKPGDAFKIGDVLTVKMTRVDVASRRIILSAKAYLQDADRSEVEQFLKDHLPNPNAAVEAESPVATPAAAEEAEDLPAE